MESEKWNFAACLYILCWLNFGLKCRPALIKYSLPHLQLKGMDFDQLRVLHYMLSSGFHTFNLNGISWGLLITCPMQCVPSSSSTVLIIVLSSFIWHVDLKIRSNIRRIILIFKEWKTSLVCTEQKFLMAIYATVESCLDLLFGPEGGIFQFWIW